MQKKIASIELTFRESMPSDVESLFDVHARTRENPICKEQLAQLGITLESITEDFASGRVKGWVCLDRGELVGFCNGNGGTGEVLVLAVLAEYEACGIGSNLLARVVEWLRSVGFSTLWLAASPDLDTRAHGFYRSLGWHPNGEVSESGDEMLVFEADTQPPPSITEKNP